MSVWRARASPAFALSESSTSSSRESSTVRLICKRYLSSRPGVSTSRAGEDGTRAVSKVLSPTVALRAQPLYRAHRDQDPGSGVPYRGEAAHGALAHPEHPGGLPRFHAQQRHGPAVFITSPHLCPPFPPCHRRWSIGGKPPGLPATIRARLSPTIRVGGRRRWSKTTHDDP